MNILHSVQDLQKIKQPIVYALGTFDGIHVGHQTVIKKAIEIAKVHEAVPVVVTFDAHPLHVLQPEKEPVKVCQTEMKWQELKTLGIQYILELPMNMALLEQSCDVFMNNLLEGNMVKAFVVGANFTYGAGGVGTPETMKSFVAHRDIDVIAVPLTEYATLEAPISSTVIRQAVQRGDMEIVRSLLGRPFSFIGTVIQGDQRGRILGFPTLNFMFPSDMATPPDGVYVNRVCIDGVWHDGVGNMGDNPTFDNQYHRFEVHILDFNQNIYGKTVIVEFYKFLRGEVKFTSLDALVAQLHKDEQEAVAYLKEIGLRQ